MITFEEDFERLLRVLEDDHLTPQGEVNKWRRRFLWALYAAGLLLVVAALLVKALIDVGGFSW